jgi:hypothetical protein
MNVAGWGMTYPQNTTFQQNATRFAENVPGNSSAQLIGLRMAVRTRAKMAARIFIGQNLVVASDLSAGLRVGFSYHLSSSRLWRIEGRRFAVV